MHILRLLCKVSPVLVHQLRRFSTNRNEQADSYIHPKTLFTESIIILLPFQVHGMDKKRF